MITYTLSAVEERRRKEWLEEHAKACSIGYPELSLGATANHRICFRPGMIADSVSLLCDCGAEHDITDLDNW